MHEFSYGLPQFIISDLELQIVVASEIITSFSNDHAIRGYFCENGVRQIQFQQYFKCCIQLGSMVKIGVKLVKNLINKSLKNIF